MAPGQGKAPLPLLHDDTREEFKRKIQIVSGDIPVRIVRYFNWRLLNFHQTFASDTDYIFLSDMSLNSIIDDQTLAGTIKHNYRGTIERYVAIDLQHFPSWAPPGTPAYLKQFFTWCSCYGMTVRNTYKFSNIILCRSKVVKASIYYKQIEWPGTKWKKIWAVKIDVICWTTAQGLLLEISNLKLKYFPKRWCLMGH